jgi:hypothetical protein
MKAQADKKRHELQLEVGDNVLVKLQPYRQQSVALRKNQKLGMRYFGPFAVLAKIGNVAYKLQLPPEAKIHPVFHVSQLKLFKGNCSQPYFPLPALTNELGPVLQPVDILQSRQLVQGKKTIQQILVQWENLPEEEATWEELEEFRHQFPNYNLEDKVEVIGGSDVREPIEESQLDKIEESTVSTRGQEITNENVQGKRYRTPNIRLRDFKW